MKKPTLKEMLKDRTILMKSETILSDNRVVGWIIGILDLLIFLSANYGVNFFMHSVTNAFKEEQIKIFSIRYLLPCSFIEFILIMIFILIVDVVLFFKIKVSWSPETFNVGQKGTQRFTTKEEIKEQYLEIEPLDVTYPGKPGILISRIDNKFYIDNRIVNNLMLGITQSGKDQTLVLTSIEIYSRAEEQPSVLINDPKIETYKRMAPELRRRNYDVYLLNASNPSLSMGFNIIVVAIDFYRKKDYDTCEMVVNSVAHSYFNVDSAKDNMKYFSNCAKALFSAMVLAAISDAFKADQIENNERLRKWKRLPEHERKKHPFEYTEENVKTINIYSLIINFGQLVTKPITKDGSRTLLDKYFEDRPTFDRARLKYLGVEVAPGKTKSGIFSEMLNELDVFTLHNVAKMTAESSLDLAEIGFGKKPVAVFLAVPSYDSSLYKLPSIFIRQVYYVLGKLCDEGKGRCERQVKIILNEVGNLPEIELMKVMTTMGLGQNISMDFYLQNYEQLSDIYGEKIAETIKGNCGNHIYIMTNSEDTAKEFSEKLGNKSMIDFQRNGGKLSLNKYFMEKVEERPLLNKNELGELLEGETVIVRKSKRRDLKNQKIRPRPIFNSTKENMDLWFAYRFFPEDRFPDPFKVNFSEICDESRVHIEPRERLWDLRKSWKILEQNKQEMWTLEMLGYEKFIPFFQKSFGKDYEKESGINKYLTVAEAVSIISESEIPFFEKEIIIDQILNS